ncbi:tetratricopeptide repeat protein [Streptomyces europaeiscabiei]|uniref:tetratricopeptide repeat protein n=1 Tax=Streptomyces europaeiscabiei TaxID=146819 RepID=UPI0029BA897A|nr:tetratricopeptide repeat protein [Streptomyces europaeiscabiei]MDX3697723.1 tetratricopeptide repeat protein [Streptomyces europaeiscabiei]
MYGSLAFGQADEVHYHAAPRPSLSWPHVVGVPPPQAAAFQDRAATQQLERADTDGYATVLSGMGGVGKTQLAADHARTLLQAGQLDLLVWITAATRTAIVAAYAQAAEEVLGADPTDSERAAREFQSWLIPKPGTGQRRWLIVLDDLADPADLQGLWPPDSSYGHTLVTTRRREPTLTTGRRRLVPVDVFTPDEAVVYLVQALSEYGRHEKIDQLLILTNTLGHLPLALSQAAAYLSLAPGLPLGCQPHCDHEGCTSYLARLTDRTQALAESLPDRSGLPDDQAATVAAAWSLSIDRANELPPAGLAHPMLQLAATLDPNGIPVTVLTSPPALTHLGEHHAQASMKNATAEDAIGVLQALHRLSLIDYGRQRAPHTVRVHQLVQRAVRERLLPMEQNQFVRIAADALTSVWETLPQDRRIVDTLCANVNALTNYQEEPLIGTEGPHPVFFYMGNSLGETGRITAAIRHWYRIASASSDLRGPEHPSTLMAWSNAARWRGEAGDWKGALSAYEQLLVVSQRTVGPDSIITTSIRRGVARWRGEAGDRKGALSAYEQLLADSQRILGPGHRHTLAIQLDLARALRQAGYPERAVTTYQQWLADGEQILGADDFDVLAVRGNLAGLRGETGDLEGAVSDHERLVEQLERILGPDHRNTAVARHNLAHWRGEAGDPDGAVACLEQLLEHIPRVFDPDHPHVLTIQRSLAYWRGKAGDAVGAVTVYEQLVNDGERVLGPGNPDTLVDRGNLARWRGEAGDPDGAAADYERLVKQLERILGPDHPTTRTTRVKLARWRGAAG